MPDLFLTDPNDAQAATRAARHLAICEEMLELGMQALRIAAKAMQTPAESPPQGAPPPPDATTRFERLARCIRQTMLLENHIADARRAIVTKTIQLEKDRAFAASFTHTPEPARERLEHPRCERLHRENLPMPATEAEIPSLLATVSEEIGVDLTNPAVLERNAPIDMPYRADPAPD